MEKSAAAALVLPAEPRFFLPTCALLHCANVQKRPDTEHDFLSVCNLLVAASLRHHTTYFNIIDSKIQQELASSCCQSK